MLHKHKPKTTKPISNTKTPLHITLTIIIIATITMQHKQMPNKNIEKVINILKNKIIILNKVQISIVKDGILISIV